MHIAFVAPLISKDATGLSSYIVDLVPRLCDAGHQVTVIGTDCGYRGAEGQELVKIDSRARFKTFLVKGKINRRLYRSVELRHWLEQHLSEFDVVDIQGVWTWVANDAARCCLRAGVGYVLTPHGMMTRWDWRKKLLMKKVFYALRLRKVWTQSTAVRYLSAGELDNSMVGPPLRFAIIPNAIEIQERSSSPDNQTLRAHFGFNPTGPVILFLGRVTNQKGVLELLQAFERLQHANPVAQLAIAGPIEASYKASLHEYTQAHPNGRIRFLGPVFGEEKLKLLSIASLFVTLSKNEGLSIAALEALGMGVPVVLTRASNLPEAEAGGAGVTTRCDPEAAAKDITCLLQDRGRLESMRDKAKAVAVGHFSWEAVLPRLIALYAQVASEATIGITAKQAKDKC